MKKYFLISPQDPVNYSLFLRRILWIISYFILSAIEASAQNVGIGTSTPVARLHIVDSSVVFSAADGAVQTPGPPPIEFHGRRMMWYADKAAFRAGYVPDRTWDKDSIGNYSFASGFGTMAKGEASTALGYSTAAIGNYSIAMGNFTLASGDYSTALGWTSIASGPNATAMGSGTKALNISSTAMGGSTTASGDYSTSMGLGTNASGFASTAMCQGNASGNWSTAMGYLSNASGNYSVAAGNQSLALGTYSFAMGNQCNTNGQSSIAMGHMTSSTAIASIALGQFTYASGNYSFAAGKNVSTNFKQGAFFFGDSDPNTRGVRVIGFHDQFAARFNGGYYFITRDVNGTDVGAVLGAGSSSWSVMSDKKMKENFLPVNGEELLSKIKKLKSVTWNYKNQDPGTSRHYGPMAQDFFEAFGKDDYGTIGCDTLINQHDFLGVNLIAIQALEKRTTQLQVENNRLKKDKESLEERVEILEKLIKNISK